MARTRTAYKRKKMLRRAKQIMYRTPAHKLNQGTIYKFKRNVDLGKINTVYGVSGIAVGYSFQISDLPNYTEFTNLFDQYQISGIKFRLVPMQNEQPLGTAVLTLPPLYMVIDYDDGNTPANAAELLQYENCKICTPISGKQIVRYFKPHAATAAYSGAFTSYANNRSLWIDSASVNVQHYGVKIFQATPATVNMTWEVVATYYLKFKNVR